VALVGLPIMMAEIFMGRETQSSPVGAFRALSRPRSPWMGFGWLGVAAAFVILSYYSVVAGWCLHYTWTSISTSFRGLDGPAAAEMFGQLHGNAALTSMWHLIFMALTVGIVVAGVQKGIERGVKVLMPMLFALMLLLLVYALTTGTFGQALDFMFRPKPGGITGEALLQALAQAFFSLSLGMGALITYGSYLRREDDLVATSTTVVGLDTGVALMGGLVLFPILFAAGLGPEQGVGLAFISLPVAFANIPGGLFLGPAFFLLLTFAALTSAISLLEVATAYFIDERGWSRPRAALLTGGAITLLGIPSALSGSPGFFGEGLDSLIGRSWFDLFEYVASNWMLPIGGLGIAAIVAWKVGDAARERGFKVGSRWGRLYWGWLHLLRYVVPVAVIVVFLNAVGLFDRWLGTEEPPAGLDATSEVISSQPAVPES
jgi:neurotransmitter:Na+ symporter, NSS family